MGLEASEVLQGRLTERIGPLSASLPAERLVSIDGLRILAAIGIVWFHTDGAPRRDIGYAGLPVFLLIFFSLITCRHREEPTLEFLRQRRDRLLKPWLFWSVLYGLLRVVRAACLGDLAWFHEIWSLETLLTGTHIHLWYLPYAFLSGLVVYVIHRRTLKVDHAMTAFVATGVGLLLLYVHALVPASSRWMRPLPQWEFGLAAAPLGFAVGRCMMIPSKRIQQALLMAITAATLAVATTLTASGHAAAVIPYTAAVVLVCLAYAWHVHENPIVAALAPLTLGVYLVHPLVHYGLNRVMIMERYYGMSVALTVCLSGLVTLVLMKTPMRKFV